MSTRRITLVSALCGLLIMVVSVGAAAALHESPGDAFRRGDFTRAVELLKPQVRSGDVNAQIMLGQMYLKGQGVRVDVARAMELIQKAADVGSPVAAYDMALFRVSGIGGPSDLAAAATWFRRSAHLGYKDAAYNLAVQYYKGMGVAQSDALSLRWIDAGVSYQLSVGAEDLLPKFAELKERVLANMTASEVRASEELSSPDGPLDVATILNKIDLQKQGTKAYPLGLAHLGWGGHVVALVLVRADGTVAETRIEASSGYQQLDELTSRLLAGARIMPKLRNGAPTDSWQLLQWHWSATEEPWNSFGKLNAMRQPH